MATRLFYYVMLLSMGVFFWGCTSGTGSGASGSNEEQLIVFLVRHADTWLWDTAIPLRPWWRYWVVIPGLLLKKKMNTIDCIFLPSLRVK